MPERRSHDTLVEPYDGSSARRVWKTFFARHVHVLHERRDEIADEYFLGLSRLSLSPDDPPTIAELDRCLGRVGWELGPVDGYLHPELFFEYLGARRFPLSVPIRDADHVGYSPMPDFIHDVLGHLPFLLNESYTRCVTAIAQRYLREPPCTFEDDLYQAQLQEGMLSSVGASRASIDEARALVRTINRTIHANPSPRARARMLYLWALEFGFIGHGGARPQVVGAAILSSHDELLHAIQQRKIPLASDDISTSYGFTELQSRYFSFAGWRHLESLVADG